MQNFITLQHRQKVWYSIPSNDHFSFPIPFYYRVSKKNETWFLANYTWPVTYILNTTTSVSECMPSRGGICEPNLIWLIAKGLHILYCVGWYVRSKAKLNSFKQMSIGEIAILYKLFNKNPPCHPYPIYLWRFSAAHVVQLLGLRLLNGWICHILQGSVVYTMISVKIKLQQSG